MRASVTKFLELGSASMVSAVKTCCRVTDRTSTIGVSPVTVTVSATAPTRSSALTETVPEPLSSIPSRRWLLNPVNVNVTTYAPGRRSSSWYRPLPSVCVVRTFSISTSLAASTVTPGNTAPELSLTVPVSDACAYATAGIMSRHATTSTALTRTRMLPPPAAADRPRPPCSTR